MIFIDDLTLMSGDEEYAAFTHSAATQSPRVRAKNSRVVTFPTRHNVESAMKQFVGNDQLSQLILMFPGGGTVYLTKTEDLNGLMMTSEGLPASAALAAHT
jgi:hypothetical protein